MKINWDKIYDAKRYHGRIPRKIKKYLFGTRIRKYKLHRMLDETVMGPPITTMYQRREFYPHGAFCPKCGHTGYYGTGNRASYPEHLETFYCFKCKNVVGYIDNSPFIHALERKEYDYNPIL